jgi:hypothetical protein
MDKTSTYIEMCSRATEMQRRWKQAYGDFYADGKGRISCWIQSRSELSSRFKGGFRIRSEASVIRLEPMVWLPRQDQIIEMCQLPGRSYDSVVMEFYGWTRDPYDTRLQLPGKRFPSMEQIWLAFFMHRRYRKKWNGAAWKATG